MSQQQRIRTRDDVTPPRPSDLAAAPAADPAAAGQVQLIAGADVQDLELGGRTVHEARLVAQAVFGIRPDARALVDGREVGEEHVLVAGQRLEFTRRAGQKGATDAVVQVAGDRATWRSHGSAAGTMPLRNLVDRLADAGSGPERWHLYPRHVRLMATRRHRHVVGMVIEMPPGPRRVSWIADDSPAAFGPGTTFDERELSFPWVVLLVVFAHGELTGLQQAFYRTAPIASLDDRLGFTNLLNVARGYGQESWVCFENVRRRLRRLDWSERVAALCEHFWQAAFTRSSEIHEDNSFWQTSASIDRRLATADAWEEATRRHPYFALEIAWRPAPEPLGVTLSRMLDMVSPWRPIERVEQLVTLMQPEE
jgi:hypothetical protein